ncbi:MAG: bifunctional diaminohydroxyphosphoribosylaminopyrimidine deaminase/5-amino-6-(5-phosphoribosylamino)uracil reductase RibD [Acholeplasmataceae bacterium]|jgi:diaminohydroxyphosphoribosylaminopyrimidine deaminase/5-amino-6-(5-phosphoribosylamino)uracil reductase|nr:bifunctional diaminohydroxyphosphoribosylaminopyrimidine deaminase/5-amino-6-(5-phosphoribosylamino)uracil reductase RibD [Acholeplasmataceae bacterium]
MNKNDYMKKAIDLADKGKGFVNPNPLVGAVIVKNGNIIGEGYHEQFGSAHAEVNAFLNATEDVEGAEMYVTLEPCSHYGKTPPCALKIIEKKIKKVYISQLDPNPLVNSKGVKLLKDAGIEVEYGILEDESRKQNEIFLKYIQTKKPFVALKYAMTLDGKIATRSGDSKWITNEKSRAFVHDLRNQYQAILVGVGTINKDNPKLNTRRNEVSRDPIRVIIDLNLDINMNSYVIETSETQPTIIYTSTHADQQKIALLKNLGVQIIQLEAFPFFNLNDVLVSLGEQKIDSVLVEGGSQILGSFIEQKCADKAYVFIAPKFIAGSTGLSPVGGQGVLMMKDAYQLKHTTVKTFDEDVLIEGYFNNKGEYK